MNPFSASTYIQYASCHDIVFFSFPVGMTEVLGYITEQVDQNTIDFVLSSWSVVKVKRQWPKYYTSMNHPKNVKPYLLIPELDYQHWIFFSSCYLSYMGGDEELEVCCGRKRCACLTW